MADSCRHQGAMTICAGFRQQAPIEDSSRVLLSVGALRFTSLRNSRNKEGPRMPRSTTGPALTAANRRRNNFGGVIEVLEARRLLCSLHMPFNPPVELRPDLLKVSP